MRGMTNVLQRLVKKHDNRLFYRNRSTSEIKSSKKILDFVYTMNKQKVVIPSGIGLAAIIEWETVLIRGGVIYSTLLVWHKRLAITLENVIPTNVIGRLFLVSWAIIYTSRLVARYCSNPGYDLRKLHGSNLKKSTRV